MKDHEWNDWRNERFAAEEDELYEKAAIRARDASMQMMEERRRELRSTPPPGFTMDHWNGWYYVNEDDGTAVQLFIAGTPVWFVRRGYCGTELSRMSGEIWSFATHPAATPDLIAGLVSALQFAYDSDWGQL